MCEQRRGRKRWNLLHAHTHKVGVRVCPGENAVTIVVIVVAIVVVVVVIVVVTCGSALTVVNVLERKSSVEVMLVRGRIIQLRWMT